VAVVAELVVVLAVQALVVVLVAAHLAVLHYQLFPVKVCQDKVMQVEFLITTLVIMVLAVVAVLEQRDCPVQTTEVVKVALVLL
jgi:hypothetical protein